MRKYIEVEWVNDSDDLHGGMTHYEVLYTKNRTRALSSVWSDVDGNYWEGENKKGRQSFASIEHAKEMVEKYLGVTSKNEEIQYSKWERYVTIKNLFEHGLIKRKLARKLLNALGK